MGKNTHSKLPKGIDAIGPAGEKHTFRSLNAAAAHTGLSSYVIRNAIEKERPARNKDTGSIWHFRWANAPTVAALVQDAIAQANVRQAILDEENLLTGKLPGNTYAGVLRQPLARTMAAPGLSAYLTVEISRLETRIKMLRAIQADPELIAVLEGRDG